jgi:hypothetical protein
MPVTNMIDWHFGGLRVLGPKFAALGRRNWYSGFANYLTGSLGKKVYLLDFMDWIDENDPQGSLLYFIRTADRIDVHLKGITKEDLHHATAGFGRRAAGPGELMLPYMTSWEINRLFHDGYVGKAHWHVSDAMGREEAFEALGGAVSLERIHDSPKTFPVDLGARRMSAETLQDLYRNKGLVELQKLIGRIQTSPYAQHLRFYESWGTLVVEVYGKQKDQRTGVLEVSVHHRNSFIVQAHDGNGQVTIWDRNTDTDRLEGMIIELVGKG